MTLEEFGRDWQKYAIVEKLGKRPRLLALKDVFESCKKFEDRLSFSVKNSVSCSWFIRCDENGYCYYLDNSDWKRIGRLALLEELEKNPKYLKRLDRCTRLFWLKTGGY